MMDPCQPRTLTDSSPSLILKWHALVKILDPVGHTDIKNDRGDLGDDLTVVIRMLECSPRFLSGSDWYTPEGGGERMMPGLQSS